LKKENAFISGEIKRGGERDREKERERREREREDHFVN
jgi:hypothetical protein